MPSPPTRKKGAQGSSPGVPKPSGKAVRAFASLWRGRAHGMRYQKKRKTGTDENAASSAPRKRARKVGSAPRPREPGP